MLTCNSSQRTDCGNNCRVCEGDVKGGELVGWVRGKGMLSERDVKLDSKCCNRDEQMSAVKAMHVARDCP